MKEGRGQKAGAYSKSILSRRLFSLFNEQKNKGGSTLGFAKQHQNKPQPSALFSLFSLNTIAFIPSGANKQKIKRIDHSNCNVRASKNAGQAFSTQWYLYSCNGLFFLFSVCWLHVNVFNSFWEAWGWESWFCLTSRSLSLFFGVFSDFANFFTPWFTPKPGTYSVFNNSSCLYSNAPLLLLSIQLNNPI